MGLKGYRLRAMGQLDSTCRAPPSPTGAPRTGPSGGQGFAFHRVVTFFGYLAILAISFLCGALFFGQNTFIQLIQRHYGLSV
jgi:hypothetical protein